MKNIVLIALLVAGAAVALLLARQAPQSSAGADTELDSGALMASPAPQAAERIKVTARGLNIKAEKWDHSDAKQKPIRPSAQFPDAPGLIRNPNNAQGKIGINVGGPHGKWTVGIDSLAAHEGGLYRIHVDRPGNSPQVIVLGFYDALDSDSAYLAQAYECKKCPGNVTVCGVSPACF